MPAQSPNNRREKEFLVGAQKKLSGALDTSRALRLNPDDSREFAAAIRKSELKIPDYVQPGSWGMVWYDLRNARYLNTERLKRSAAGEVSVDEKKVRELERKLGIEMSILTDPMVNTEAVESLRKLSVQDTSAKDVAYYTEVQNQSALEIEQRVQKFLDFWENEIGENQLVSIGDHIESFPVTIKELRMLAEELQGRLLAEGSKKTAAEK